MADAHAFLRGCELPPEQLLAAIDLHAHGSEPPIAAFWSELRRALHVQH
jgi:hypothetical protein